jgi:hypothetical protein
MNNKQHDALFFFSLLSYHTFTAIGPGPLTVSSEVQLLPFAKYMHSTS